MGESVPRRKESFGLMKIRFMRSNGRRVNKENLKLIRRVTFLWCNIMLGQDNNLGNFFKEHKG